MGTSYNLLYRRRAYEWDLPDFETLPEAKRPRVRVKNPEGPIRMPFTYIRCHLFFLDHKIDGSCLSSHFHCRIPSSNGPHCFIRRKKYFASHLPKMDCKVFAKANPSMQKGFEFETKLISICSLYHLHCLFVFEFFALLVLHLCFWLCEQYCCCWFFAKFSLNISCYSIMLWVYLCGFNVVVMFMFHCTISMGSIRLQLLVHHVCFYITITSTLLIMVHHKCSYITIVPTSQSPCIIIALASLIFLCHKCFCIAIIPTLLIFLQHGIFFWGATCVISNFSIFVFFSGFSIL